MNCNSKRLYKLLYFMNILSCSLCWYYKCKSILRITTIFTCFSYLVISLLYYCHAVLVIKLPFIVMLMVHISTGLLMELIMRIWHFGELDTREISFIWCYNHNPPYYDGCDIQQSHLYMTGNCLNNNTKVYCVILCNTTPYNVTRSSVILRV